MSDEEFQRLVDAARNATQHIPFDIHTVPTAPPPDQYMSDDEYQQQVDATQNNRTKNNGGKSRRHGKKSRRHAKKSRRHAKKCRR